MTEQPPEATIHAEHYYKTEMCKFYSLGICDRGSACRFAHGVAEVHEQPDFSFTQLCKEFKRTGRCSSDSCNFAHDVSELRSWRRGKTAAHRKPLPNQPSAPAEQDRLAKEPMTTHGGQSVQYSPLSVRLIPETDMVRMDSYGTAPSMHWAMPQRMDEGMQQRQGIRPQFSSIDSAELPMAGAAMAPQQLHSPAARLVLPDRSSSRQVAPPLMQSPSADVVLVDQNRARHLAEAARDSQMTYHAFDGSPPPHCLFSAQDEDQLLLHGKVFSL